MSDAIQWPALLRRDGEVDIQIVESGDQWRRDTDLSGYDEPGLLVASDGRVYDLAYEPPSPYKRFLGHAGYQRPVRRDGGMTRPELLEFVGPHLGAVSDETWEEFRTAADEVGDHKLLEFTIDYLRSRL